MKNSTFILLIISAFAAGFIVKTLVLKQKTDTMPEVENDSRKLDEQLIRKTEASYDSAWQQGNIEGLLACFTDDAILISPRGDEAFGKDQIRDLFTGFLSHEARNTKHTSSITRISFISNDVAIVDGEAFIDGKENLSTAVKHHRFVDVLIRKGDIWLIAQIRAFAIN
ncbi:MAG TPA: SgcJ/EcaC family oxidoreductase [Phnomibacter sp.]|nr:SgcJ/EcaC family oxidoreductase [Phnomibacter sp.]